MASWFYTRILIVCTLAWAIIMMSYSAWQTQIFEGNWGKVTVKSETSNNGTTVTGEPIPNFEDFCEQTPYAYLRPFAFAPSQASSNLSDDPTNLSICPWPQSNSGFRLFIVLVQMIFLVVLLFENFISRSALSTLLMYSFAFGLMVTFSIDSYAAVNGSYICADTFKNTAFSSVLSTNGIGITCHPYNFNGMVVIDVVAVLLNFGLMRMWATCDDKFGDTPYRDGDGGSDTIPTRA